MGLTPQPFHLPCEVELIERADMHKVGVFACNLVSELIFFGRLMTAAPFAQSADCVLVRSFQDVFCRETASDDHQHDLLAAVEPVLPGDQARDAAIAAPVLAYRSEIGECTGQVVLLKSAFSW